MTSEHTQKAFSALRDARGLGVAGVGVACRAWLGVGLVVVVAMSLSLFTEHAGSLVDWLVRWLVLVLGHVYIRTMCTLVHAAPRTRHNASLPDGARRDVRD